jgi:cell division protein FtsB
MMSKRNTLKSDRNSRSAYRRKLIAATGILFALYLIANFIFGEMGVIKYYRMKMQYDTLTKDIATLKQDNAKLAGEVRALKTDPEYLEQIARDKLGLARQGEIVYYYGEP